MGLYLLNISVDVADPGSANNPENLSFNDQESIIEIVVEKILGFENAIEEFEDHDPEENGNKRTLKVDFATHGSLDCPAFRSTREPNSQRFPTYEAGLTIGHHSTDTPPPEA